MDRDHRKNDHDLREQESADAPVGGEPLLATQPRSPASRKARHLDSVHPNVSACVVRIQVAVLAHFFHRSTFTPATRSHRQSDPSPNNAGSWIQGTRLDANSGANMAAKL